MPKAKPGDTVRVHYKGKLENGQTFDESTDREPLEFTIGDGQVITGFEEAVVGMCPGESKTVKIPAEKAYGPHQKELVFAMKRSGLLPDFEPKVGQQVQIRRISDRQTILATVAKVSDSTVTLDANHPLAGEDLIFDLQLVDITA